MAHQLCIYKKNTITSNKDMQGTHLSVEKKAKLEEDTKKFGVLLATHLGSAEVARQPH